MTNPSALSSNNPVTILDTGIFVYTTRLLSTALGAAFIYSIDRSGYKLGMPEVVELEIRKHTQRLINGAISNIAEGFRVIEMTIGSRDDYRVPTAEEINERLDQRLVELQDFIVRIPFTLQHANGALERVMAETPPNRPNDQQFKDSAIWEAILELSQQSDVHFVTEDKSFFENRKPESGLAINLLHEAEKVEHQITVHYRLAEYLGRIRDELPSLDKDKIAKSIVEILKEDLLEKAAEKCYQLGELFRHEISAFITERPQTLAIDFQLNFEVNDIAIPDTDEITDGIEMVAGNCSFNTATEQPEDIQLRQITITDLGGKPIPGYGHHFLIVGSAVIGRKMVTYTLRGDLP